MQTDNPVIQNDEIDIYEIWATIVKRKLTILTATVIFGLTAAVYVWTATPIYSGSVLIEVGEGVNTNNGSINNGSKTIFYLDNINTLKEITAQISGLKAEVPSGVADMLRISTEGPDKAAIHAQLDSAVQFILKRHIEKAKLYQDEHTKITMTQIVGNITLSDSPIKPKKGAIIAVSLISGLILGLFIAFSAEFLQRGRRKRD